jgi:FkbM family methyltransferase
MLNLKIGSAAEVDGQQYIITRIGAPGHAVYGPYERREPGYYSVQFNINFAEPVESDAEAVCARVDVAGDQGSSILARRDIRVGDFQSGALSVDLPFSIAEPKTLEYRVYSHGLVPLKIGAYCRVTSIPKGVEDSSSIVAAERFPDAAAAKSSSFFRENVGILRQLYEQGAGVSIVGNDVVVTVSGVSLNARCFDDLKFIGEIFFRNAYNIMLQRDACVIDIGMNIGLTSLFVAKKEEVQEVHSFEPFKETYDRAVANIALNPELAKKIKPNNYGLSDRNEVLTVLIADEGNSGSFSVYGSRTGTPKEIVIRNVAEVLKPILSQAKAKKLDVIAKVDCEGSEFPIFKVLEANDLFKEISAFMVEWHRGANRSQADLIAPLLENGFIVFDITGQVGNGFFYAVRSASHWASGRF